MNREIKTTPGSRDPKAADRTAEQEQMQRINNALSQFAEYNRLFDMRREAQNAKRRHGALDDKIDEIKERGDCISVRTFFDEVCKDVPEIRLPPEYEGNDDVVVKILPDGRIARNRHNGEIEFVELNDAITELSRVERDYGREIEELQRKQAGVKAALEQLNERF